MHLFRRTYCTAAYVYWPCVEGIPHIRSFYINSRTKYVDNYTPYWRGNTIIVFLIYLLLQYISWKFIAVFCVEMLTKCYEQSERFRENFHFTPKI
jgi:hypothetical protein